MQKKEVKEALKRCYLIGGIAMGTGFILTIIFIFIMPMIAMLFIMLGIIVFAMMYSTIGLKAKKMEANACIKCATSEKTEVTKDELFSQETVNGVLYEVHLVTHTCKNCGTEYTCHEYKKV